jgi:hypothetical protein
MRTLAAFVAGLLLSVVTFSTGVIGAILYLSTPEPASFSRTSGVTDLWTTKPTVVARSQRGLVGVGSDQISGLHSELGNQSNELIEQKVVTDAEPDRFSTGSIVEELNQSPKTLFFEHVQWCTSRFNSYRAADGTYQPYNGKRRRCVSPYIADGIHVHDDDRGAADEILLSSHRSLGDGDQGDPLVTADIDDHTRKCSERYKSYRAEDNTYQPYNGGPRRQCR